MKTLRYTILPVVLSAVWVSASEFLRNEVLFKSYWVEHYAGLGLEFPSALINAAMWGVWSLLFAIAVLVIARRFALIPAALLSWFTGFVLMWVTIGNLGVLPYRLLIFAVPLSLLEAFVAVVIVNATRKERSAG